MSDHDEAASMKARSTDPELTARFYAELHEIAERVFANERRDHTLQPTAVVNEACLRLLGSSKLPDGPRADRLALAGRVLKQVLIDHARGRDAQKRGGAAVRLELQDDLAAPGVTEIEFESAHRALDRLRMLHARQADVLNLRIFSGMSSAQIAPLLGVSERTVEQDWTVARAWLRRELSRETPEAQP